MSRCAIRPLPTRIRCSLAVLTPLMAALITAHPAFSAEGGMPVGGAGGVAPAQSGSAGQAGTAGAGGGLSPEQQQAWARFQSEADTSANPASEAAIAAEAKYVEALARYRQTHFIEARELVEQALALYPPHPGARKLQQDVLAVLAVRDNRLQQFATWRSSLDDVQAQEAAVRLDALTTSGKAKLAAGDYSGAEIDFDRVAVGLRAFPYRFDWGALPDQITGLQLEARAQANREQLDQGREDRAKAEREARAQADQQERALRAKVDELMRRARVAYARRDYRRAEVDAWNAYELDRRREDARRLYLDSRREGHVQFDDRYREDRLEKLARVHEETHKALIPQNELLVYPEDWSRRALRIPREIGTVREEAWLATLKGRLEQRVTFEFQDMGFEDVVNFLRQITGTNIVVAPDVSLAPTASTVTLKVKDVKFGNALQWIMELTKLNYAMQDQAIFISSKPIIGSVVLRMYDITDLISPVRDFPGKELAYNAGTGTGGGAGFSLFSGGGAAGAGADAKNSDPAELVEFIKKNVSPKQWDEAANPGVEIAERGGSTLFISQTPDVHGEIVRLLKNMRELSRLQVNVNVRLIEVRKDFFEEIGVEWHNSPNVLLDSTPTSGDGYRRQNSNSLFNGGLNTSRMPDNAVNYDPRLYEPNARGLILDVAYNPLTFLGTEQVNAMFTAVEEEHDAQILEHPVLTCFNGQRAHASFVHQYAYIEDYEIVGGTYDPKIGILVFGDILDVRPVVSADRKYITMEIRPSSVILQGVFVELLIAPRILLGSGVAGFLGFRAYPIELPNVQVRTLRSTVMMPDKGNLLIGGFNNSIRERTHIGIPFLSHIPFIGRFFGRDGTYDKNRKLFFLLNAEIMDLGEREALR